MDEAAEDGKQPTASSHLHIYIYRRSGCFLPNCGYVDHLRFPSLRSSGLQQEWVSSPFSSASSRIVVTVVAWADGTAPAACSEQL